jgi:hypothetical protein
VADRVRSPEKDDADFWNQPIQSSRQQPPTTRDTYEPITYHLATARDIVKHCQTVLNRRAGLLASHALIVVVRAVRYGSPGSKRCQAECTPTKLQHDVPKSPPHRRSLPRVMAARADTQPRIETGWLISWVTSKAYQIVAVDRPIRRRGRSKGRLRLRGGFKVTLCSKLPVDEIGGFVRSILGG